MSSPGVVFVSPLTVIVVRCLQRVGASNVLTPYIAIAVTATLVLVIVDLIWTLGR